MRKLYILLQITLLALVVASWTPALARGSDGKLTSTAITVTAKTALVHRASIGGQPGWTWAQPNTTSGCTGARSPVTQLATCGGAYTASTDSLNAKIGVSMLSGTSGTNDKAAIASSAKMTNGPSSFSLPSRSPDGSLINTINTAGAIDYAISTPNLLVTLNDSTAIQPTVNGLSGGGNCFTVHVARIQSNSTKTYDDSGITRNSLFNLLN